ncbi:GPI mannosyltransferase 1-like [Limulus polyphemus]|uniref:GPI alpha-1,4-mannosyltransferase I, catalytic subunit n=1 Tax=Limulus polyphemus TaxID=6850 RepID=A0ABM1B9B9_LIMPO|nr:GPI mannosyltransferase 1-like [Limulus polyphemus]XP_022244974.1 GPI mannosyltransferase 1-like [Limulus polyphemus]
MTSLAFHLSVATVLRVILIGYGEWQDRNFLVKYTDIDYYVLTDAARYIADGKSPFLRHTYRYTPLLAFLLLPNIFVSFIWGKLLFSLLDIFIGYVMYQLLKKCNISNSKMLFSVCVWLYNPLNIAVSTRGNAESLLSAVIILSLFYFYKNQWLLAGILYGLSVHLKPYPIIFAPVLYFSLTHRIVSLNQGIVHCIHKLLVPNRDRLMFLLATGVGFFLPTCICYKLYGMNYIQESFLYHITRKDTRHNFSPFFYLLYLYQGEDHYWLSFVTFIPQVILLLALAVIFHSPKDLPFCLFAQTLVFVSFNKVCTSQYFLWYLTFLPLVIPKLTLSLKGGVSYLTAWLLGQGMWLCLAYYLEFEGKNTFLYIWLAGLVFFLINVYILGVLIYNYGKQS